MRKKMVMLGASLEKCHHKESMVLSERKEKLPVFGSQLRSLDRDENETGQEDIACMGIFVSY
jgi:hypothetical protein